MKQSKPWYKRIIPERKPKDCERYSVTYNARKEI